ncbi:MAG: triose-phosphate isomerase [Bdellovibrionales bacterium]
MICAGNWKLNKDPQEATSFITQLLKDASTSEQKQLVVLPPALCLSSVMQSLQGAAVQVGGQNCDWHLSGAFTGENSPSTLAAMGAKFCLVGHSERRQLFAESDEMIARKIKVLQGQKITPIFCIGETLEEREEALTNKVLGRQLQVGLSELEPGAPLWIAYEPVWAIGTGKVATTDQVLGTHQFIREWLSKHHPALAQVPLLYGGSVKPDNAKELGKLPNVDGFLIGGASLEVPSFLGILRASV